nr:hypothetical protein [Neobacillus soli]
MLKEQGINSSFEAITKEDIKRNVYLYMKEKGLQTDTINSRLRAIKAFFNFPHRESHPKNNPLSDIKLLKDCRKVVETFTNEILATNSAIFQILQHVH